MRIRLHAISPDIVKLLEHVLLLVCLASPSFAASLTVDTTGYLTNIGTPTTAGNRGSFLLNPSGVLGYANYGGTTFTPTQSGGAIVLNLAKIGSYTVQDLVGVRFSDSVSGTPDTDTVRGATAINTGYRFSFVPGAIGNYSFTVHLADSKASVGYAVAQGGNAVGASGLLPDSGNSLYDEGIVTFNCNVANSTEATATWTFDLTHKATVSGAAIAIGGAWIVAGTPIPPPAPVVGLGKLVCIGDSITEAAGTRPAGDGNWSWRYWCWQNFVDFNITHEFVGTRTSNHTSSSVYPSYSGMTFPNRHEAIWGTTFLERSTSTPTFLSSLKASGKTPDTAVIFGGGNDVPLDLSVSAATVRDRTKVIIDNLQGDLGTAGNPNIRILLVSILPRFAAPPSTTPDVRNARFAEINSLLAALATSETTATSKVEYLDAYPLFTNPADDLLYDGTHPDGKGEQLLGNAIFAALVPNMDSVSLKIDSVDKATHTVNFLVRTHGPRQVRIEYSSDLSSSSWTTLVPQSLNPGEWVPVSYTHPSALPPQWFFRAKAP